MAISCCQNRLFHKLSSANEGYYDSTSQKRKIICEIAALIIGVTVLTLSAFLLLGTLSNGLSMSHAYSAITRAGYVGLSAGFLITIVSGIAFAYESTKSIRAERLGLQDIAIITLDPPKTEYLGVIPKDLLFVILNKLPAIQIAKCQRVNKLFLQVIKSDESLKKQITCGIFKKVIRSMQGQEQDQAYYDLLTQEVEVDFHSAKQTVLQIKKIYTHHDALFFLSKYMAKENLHEAIALKNLIKETCQNQGEFRVILQLLLLELEIDPCSLETTICILKKCLNESKGIYLASSAWEIIKALILEIISYVKDEKKAIANAKLVLDALVDPIFLILDRDDVLLKLLQAYIGLAEFEESNGLEHCPSMVKAFEIAYKFEKVLHTIEALLILGSAQKRFKATKKYLNEAIYLTKTLIYSHERHVTMLKLSQCCTDLAKKQMTEAMLLLSNRCSDSVKEQIIISTTKSAKEILNFMWSIDLEKCFATDRAKILDILWDGYISVANLEEAISIEDTKKTLDFVNQEARKRTWKQYQTNTLMKLFYSYLALNEYKSASNVLYDAFESAEWCKSDNKKNFLKLIDCFTLLVRTQMTTDVETAKETLDYAVQIASFITDSYENTKALIKLIKCYIDLAKKQTTISPINTKTSLARAFKLVKEVESKHSHVKIPAKKLEQELQKMKAPLESELQLLRSQVHFLNSKLDVLIEKVSQIVDKLVEHSEDNTKSQHAILNTKADAIIELLKCHALRECIVDCYIDLAKIQIETSPFAVKETLDYAFEIAKPIEEVRRKVRRMQAQCKIFEPFENVFIALKENSSKTPFKNKKDGLDYTFLAVRKNIFHEDVTDILTKLFYSYMDIEDFKGTKETLYEAYENSKQIPKRDKALKDIFECYNVLIRTQLKTDIQMAKENLVEARGIAFQLKDTQRSAAYMSLAKCYLALAKEQGKTTVSDAAESLYRAFALVKEIDKQFPHSGGKSLRASLVESYILLAEKQRYNTYLAKAQLDTAFEIAEPIVELRRKVRRAQGLLLRPSIV